MNKVILGLVIVCVTSLLGVLIAFNIPIVYTHKEVIYYPEEDKTYLEICKVKQSYYDYVKNNGVFEDNQILEFTQIEVDL